MSPDVFHEFLSNADTLRVYDDGRLVFSSTKDRLIPLMEYLDGEAAKHRRVVIYDKIMGNAAALLAVKAAAREIFSPLGSDLAIATLNRFHIKHQLLKTIPHIMRPDGADWCPMEKLSVDKTPEEFYQEMKSRITNPSP